MRRPRVARRAYVVLIVLLLDRLALKRLRVRVRVRVLMMHRSLRLYWGLLTARSYDAHRHSIAIAIR
jgi:hypothetical protein